MRVEHILSMVKGRRIVVVGDLMIDHSFDSKRADMKHHQTHGRREDVYEVDNSGENISPGGAAKVAATIAAFGATAICIGVTGQDQRANTLKRLAEEYQFNLTTIEEPGRPTTLKMRIILSDPPERDVMYRVDQEDRSPLAADCQRRLMAAIREASQDAAAFVIEDFQKGVISPDVVKVIAECAGRQPIIIDAKYDWEKYRSIPVSIMLASLGEFSEGALGFDRKRDRLNRTDIATSLSRWPNIHRCVVSCPGDGIYSWQRQEGTPWAADVFRVPAAETPVHPWRAVGAGSAFTGSLVLAFVSNQNLETAVQFAATIAHLQASLDPSRRLVPEVAYGARPLVVIREDPILAGDEGACIQYLFELPATRDVRLVSPGIAAGQSVDSIVDAIADFIVAPAEPGLLVVAAPGAGKSTLVSAVLRLTGRTIDSADAPGLVESKTFNTYIRSFLESDKDILLLDEFLAVESALRGVLSSLYQGTLDIAGEMVNLGKKKIIAVGSAATLSNLSQDVVTRFTSRCIVWLKNPEKVAEILDVFAARMLLHTNRSEMSIEKTVLLAVCLKYLNDEASRRTLDQLAKALAARAAGGLLRADAWVGAGLDVEFVNSSVFPHKEAVLFRGSIATTVRT